MATLLLGENGQQFVPPGMVKAFQVVGNGTALASGAAEAAGERSDGRLIFTDFAFTMPRIRAGERLLEVVNEGVQPHEILIKRLDPGKTLVDALAFARRPVGQPPYDDAGGLLVVERGERSWMTVDLIAGRYVAVCYFVDPNSGK